MPLSISPDQAVFAAIDFESAGVTKGDTDTPIQIGIAVMPGLDPAGVDSYVSYLHTSRPVTWQASQVHGITTADLSGAPTLLSLWPEVKNRLGGRLIVAHGAGTEKRFLRAFPLHGFGPWVDTLRLARRFWPGVRDYSLETLIAAGGLQEALDAACPERRFHDALYDAVASLLVLRHIIHHAGLTGVPMGKWLSQP
ncbi:MAG: 3'-5' exonuclease [Verrucomicrobiota bacterium]